MILHPITLFSFSLLPLLFLACSKDDIKDEKQNQLLTATYLQYVNYKTNAPNNVFQTRLWDVHEVKRTILDGKGKEETMFHWDRFASNEGLPFLYTHYLTFSSPHDDPNNDMRKVYSITVESHIQNAKSPLRELIPSIGNWKLSADGKKLTINQLNPIFQGDLTFYDDDDVYSGGTGVFDVVFTSSSPLSDSLEDTYNVLECTRITNLENGTKRIDYFKLVNSIDYHVSP